MPFVRLLAFFIGLILIPGNALAQNPHSWRVTKVTGTAFIAQKGYKAVRVKRGMFLNPGQTLSTRSRARLLMVRGKERMQVGPGAIMAIPPARYNKKGKTLILHQSGRLDLSVNKRNVKHFSVKTPYLTAVVKGTEFSVDVRNGRSDVTVDRGQVDVSDHSSGSEASVTAGQAVSVVQTANGQTTMRAGRMTGSKAKPAKIKQTRKKPKKPNFYTTVRVRNQVFALTPGTVSALAPTETVRSATITSSQDSPGRQTSTSRSSRISPSGSYDMTAADNQSSNGSNITTSNQITREQISDALSDLPSNVRAAISNGTPVVQGGDSSSQSNTVSAPTTSAPTTSSPTTSTPTTSAPTTSTPTTSATTTSAPTTNTPTTSTPTTSAPTTSTTTTSAPTTAASSDSSGGSWTGPLGGTFTWDGNGNTTYTSASGNTYDIGGSDSGSGNASQSWSSNDDD